MSLDLNRKEINQYTNTLKEKTLQFGDPKVLIWGTTITLLVLDLMGEEQLKIAIPL